MDLLDRLYEHDAAATAWLFDQCRPLADDQWDAPFAFGQGSVRATFEHFIDGMEHWLAVINGPDPAQETGASKNALERRYAAASRRASAVGRRLQGEGRLDETYLDTATEAPRRRTFAATLVHLPTHNMHHRAQILVMLDLLGVAYNPWAGYAIDGWPA